MRMNNLKAGFNLKFGPIVIKDAGEKIGGAVFGEKGKAIGIKKDNKTKWLTIGK